MKKKGIKIAFLINCILLSCILFYGCNNKVKEENKVEKDNVKLLNGAIVKEDIDEYSIYNLIDDKYEKVNTKYAIIFYNLQSGNFIYNENGKYKVSYNNSEEVIEENKNVISPKLSNDGKYLSYFLNDPYLDLKVKDLSSNKEISMESNVTISGDLIDWMDEKTLVYYGIDNNKNNGIFTYDIEKREEKLLYKFDLGYVEFLKALDDGIVFLQEKEGKQKLLKIIDEQGNAEEVVENIVDINDIESTSEGILILGKIEDNNYSLYKYNEGKIKRLVYGFPRLIDLEKGISKDKDGGIIFIGGEDSKNEKIYKCKDDTISIINEDDGIYHFIEFN